MASVMDAQLDEGAASGFSPNRVIPPSPEASLRMQYIETPVGHYTGLPNINIPLTTLTQGDIRLPVSVSYHAAANKVGAIASPTGLGWSLNAGGSISRVVRGLPDDSETPNNGFLTFIQNPDVSYEQLIGGNNDRWSNLDLLSQGCADSEPDLFYFNVNGLSGKFAFDWDGSLIVDSDRKVQVTPFFANDDNTETIIKWEIIDDRGFKYVFEELDYTHIENFVILSCTFVQDFVSSWYVSRIEDVNGLNSINFLYDPYPTTFTFDRSATIQHATPDTDLNCGGSVTGTLSFSANEMSHGGKIIREINSSEGNKILFKALETRTDLTDVNQPPVNSLDEIEIRDYNNVLINQFLLDYDYSTGRLTLKEIQECGSNGVCSPPYLFGYLGPELPERTSYAQDHWGFFNGATSNNHLVPGAFITLDPNDESKDAYSPGANREPSPEHMQAGILYSMIYPSGARTEFEYEPHDYAHTQTGRLLEKEKKARQVSLSKSGGACDNPTSCIAEAWDEQAFCIISDKDLVVIDVISTVSTYTIEGYFGGGLAPGVEIVDFSGNTYFSTGSSNETLTDKIKLPPGNYRARVRAVLKDPGGAAVDMASLDVSWEDEGENLIKKKMGGGVRIKRIKDFSNPSDHIPRIRKYAYELGDGMSSGVIYKEPRYVFDQTNFRILNNTAQTFNEVECQFKIRVSGNVTQLGTTSGSYLGYREVTEYRGESGEYGMVKYNFSSPLEFNDIIYDEPPFQPNMSYAHLTGQLRERTDFKYEGDDFLPILKNETTYGQINKSVFALKVAFAGGFKGSGFIHKYNLGQYALNFGHTRPTVETRTEYYNTSNNINTSNIVYDGELQNIVGRIITDSKGRQIKTSYFYPHDYTNVSADHFIQDMVDANLTGIPVEVVSDIDGAVQEAKYYEYNLYGGNLLPSKTYATEITNPTLTFDYSFDNLDGTKSVLYGSEGIAILSYDIFGNVTAFRDRSRLTTSYIWSPNGGELLASVSGADASSIYYNGFEYGDGTFNANAQAGTNVLVGNTYTIPGSQLPVGNNLILDLWYRDAQGWHYHTQAFNPLSPSFTISGAQALDEIRIYPVYAHMKTYVHKPLVGISAESDPNGHYVHFNYDDLNRLKRVKTTDKAVQTEFIYQFHSNY